MYLLSLEKLRFFVVRDNHVFGHQLVMCNVDKQFFLHKYLEVVWVETLERLFSQKQTNKS